MTFETIKNLLLPYRKIILICLGLIFLLFLGASLFQSCGNYFADRRIEKEKQNVNLVLGNIEAEKERLSNLEINEAIKEAEVNSARNAFINAQESTNKARSKVNDSLLSVNALEGKDFTNSTLANAQKARCRAFGC